MIGPPNPRGRPRKTPASTTQHQRRSLPVTGNDYEEDHASSDEETEDESSYAETVTGEGIATQKTKAEDHLEDEEDDDNDDSDDTSFHTADQSIGASHSGRMSEPSDTPTVAETTEKAKELERLERKEIFETEKRDMLESLPKCLKDLFGQIGFVKKGRANLPCVVLSPYDVEEKLRRRWKLEWSQAKIHNKPFEQLQLVVFYYGIPNSGDDKAFELVKRDQLITYDEGVKQGHHKLPAYLVRKQGNVDLSNSERMRIVGIQEMQKELDLSPKERRELCICFSEAHEIHSSLWAMSRGERRRLKGLEPDDSSSSSGELEEEEEDNPATVSNGSPARGVVVEDDNDDDETAPDGGDTSADCVKVQIVVARKRLGDVLASSQMSLSPYTQLDESDKTEQADRDKSTRNNNDSVGPSFEEIAQADAALRSQHEKATRIEKQKASTEGNNNFLASGRAYLGQDDTDGGQNGGKLFVPQTKRIKLKISMSRVVDNENKAADRATSWDEYYEQLVEHKKKHGTCKVLPSDKSKFGNWVRNQRCILGKKLRYGGISGAAGERIAKLNSLGFEWPGSKKGTAGVSGSEVPLPLTAVEEADGQPGGLRGGTVKEDAKKRVLAPAEEHYEMNYTVPLKKRHKGLKQAPLPFDGAISPKKKGPGRPRKNAAVSEDGSPSAKNGDDTISRREQEKEQPKKRGPGRPKKNAVVSEDINVSAKKSDRTASKPSHEKEQPKKRGPGRPKKNVVVSEDDKAPESKIGRKRGRPPKSGRGKESKSSTQPTGPHAPPFTAQSNIANSAAEKEAKRLAWQPRGVVAKLTDKAKHKSYNVRKPVRLERNRRPSKSQPIEDQDIPPLEDIELEVGTSTSELTHRDDIDQATECRGSHRVIDIPHAAGVLPPPRFNFLQVTKPSTQTAKRNEDGTFERPDEDPPGPGYFWDYAAGAWKTRPQPEGHNWQQSNPRPSNSGTQNCPPPHPQSPSRRNPLHAHLELHPWQRGGRTTPLSPGKSDDVFIRELGVRYKDIPAKDPVGQPVKTDDDLFLRPKEPTPPGYSWNECRGKWIPLEREALVKKLASMSESEKAQLRGELRGVDNLLSPASFGTASPDEMRILHQIQHQGRDGLIAHMPVPGAGSVLNDCASLTNPRDPTWCMLSPGGASLPSLAPTASPGAFDLNFQFPESDRGALAGTNTEKLGNSPVPHGRNATIANCVPKACGAERVPHLENAAGPQPEAPGNRAQNTNANNNLGIPNLTEGTSGPASLSLRPREEPGNQEGELRQIGSEKDNTKTAQSHTAAEGQGKLSSNLSGSPQEATIDRQKSTEPSHTNESDSASETTSWKGQDANEGASSLSTAPAENTGNPGRNQASNKPGRCSEEGAVATSEPGFSAASQGEKERLAISSRDVYSIGESNFPKGPGKLAPSSPALISKEGSSVDGDQPKTSSECVTMEKSAADDIHDEKATNSLQSSVSEEACSKSVGSIEQRPPMPPSDVANLTIASTDNETNRAPPTNQEARKKLIHHPSSRPEGSPQAGVGSKSGSEKSRVANNNKQSANRTGRQGDETHVGGPPIVLQAIGNPWTQSRNADDTAEAVSKFEKIPKSRSNHQGLDKSVAKPQPAVEDSVVNSQEAHKPKALAKPFPTSVAKPKDTKPPEQEVSSPGQKAAPQQKAVSTPESSVKKVNTKLHEKKVSSPGQHPVQKQKATSKPQSTSKKDNAQPQQKVSSPRQNAAHQQKAFSTPESNVKKVNTQSQEKKASSPGQKAAQKQKPIPELQSTVKKVTTKPQEQKVSSQGQQPVQKQNAVSKLQFTVKKDIAQPQQMVCTTLPEQKDNSHVQKPAENLKSAAKPPPNPPPARKHSGTKSLDLNHKNPAQKATVEADVIAEPKTTVKDSIGKHSGAVSRDLEGPSPPQQPRQEPTCAGKTTAKTLEPGTCSGRENSNSKQQATEGQRSLLAQGTTGGQEETTVENIVNSLSGVAGMQSRRSGSGEIAHGQELSKTSGAVRQCQSTNDTSTAEIPDRNEPNAGGLASPSQSTASTKDTSTTGKANRIEPIAGGGQEEVSDLRDKELKEPSADESTGDQKRSPPGQKRDSSVPSKITRPESQTVSMKKVPSKRKSRGGPSSFAMVNETCNGRQLAELLQNRHRRHRGGIGVTTGVDVLAQIPGTAGQEPPSKRARCSASASSKRNIEKTPPFQGVKATTEGGPPTATKKSAKFQTKRQRSAASSTPLEPDKTAQKKKGRGARNDEPNSLRKSPLSQPPPSPAIAETNQAPAALPTQVQQLPVPLPRQAQQQPVPLPTQLQQQPVPLPTQVQQQPVPQLMCSLNADSVPSIISSSMNPGAAIDRAVREGGSRVLEVEDAGKPHPRNECPIKHFRSRHLGTLENVSLTNQHYCKNCLCFVCEVAPELCAHWESHQNANHEDIIWVDMRTIKRRNTERARLEREGGEQKK